MNARIIPGDRVLVLGPGPIGILCAAIARLSGAEVAIAGLERDRVRLEKARAYGCEVIIGNPLPWTKGGDGLGIRARPFHCCSGRAPREWPGRFRSRVSATPRPSSLATG